MARAKIKDTFNYEEIARQLGLPSWEDFWERHEVYGDRGLEREMYHEWSNCVGFTFDRLLEQVCLTSKTVSKNRVKVILMRDCTWRDAAHRLLEIAEGYGYPVAWEEYERKKNWRKVVLEHLWWIRRLPEVTGLLPSPRTIFDRCLRGGLVGSAHLGAPLSREEVEKLISRFWHSVGSARKWLRHADLNYRAGDLYRCCIATNRAEREHSHAEGYFDVLLALLGRPTMEREGIYDRLADELARLSSEIDGGYDRCRCFAAWQQL